MHHPVAIANYFVNKSKNGLSLMQLLKLSYIAHGVVLAVYDKALSKELVQAWKYGPVFASVYHAFKFCTSDLIKKGWHDELFSNVAVDEDNLDSDFSFEEKEVMDAVYEKYGYMDGWQLSKLTHAEDTPWYTSYYKGDAPGRKYYGVTISNEKIKEHFRKKLNHIDKSKDIIANKNKSIED